MYSKFLLHKFEESIQSADERLQGEVEVNSQTVTLRICAFFIKTDDVMGCCTVD